MRISHFFIDRPIFASVVSIVFIAIPGFWLGLLIVLALLFWFGYKAPIIIVHVWENPWQNLQQVIQSRPSRESD